MYFCVTTIKRVSGAFSTFHLPLPSTTHGFQSLLIFNSSLLVTLSIVPHTQLIHFHILYILGSIGIGAASLSGFTISLSTFLISILVPIISLVSRFVLPESPSYLFMLTSLSVPWTSFHLFPVDCHLDKFRSHLLHTRSSISLYIPHVGFVTALVRR